MRILIVGAGKAGWHLAETLCQEKHDVVVIDRDAEALAELEAQIDVLTTQGSGSSPRVLEEAEIRKADLIAAVTNQDETNILACLYARQAGVPNRVARIRDTDYYQGVHKLDLGATGVDLVVSKTQSIANELYNVLLLPGTLEVLDLFDSHIQMVGFRVHMDNPLVRSPLQDVADPEMLDHSRFIAVMRGDKLIVPRGDTRFLIGDDVYVASKSSYTKTLHKWTCPEHASFEKIIIAGGGELGLSLARRLESEPNQVVLIEADKERAVACSSVLDRTLVLCGDALDEEMLGNGGIVPGTAFVASMGTDENNIIGCLLAEKLGANYTLAQISKPQYVSIINSQSLLDRAVSPYVTMSNSILHFIRGKYVKSAALSYRLPGELVEMDLSEGSPWKDKPVRKLKMPKDTVIVAVRRGTEVLIPTGNLELHAKDVLLLFTRASSLRKLGSLICC